MAQLVGAPYLHQKVVFDSWSGYIPRLRFSTLVGEYVGGNQSMLLSYIDVSLSLSLSLSLSNQQIYHPVRIKNKIKCLSQWIFMNTSTEECPTTTLIIFIQCSTITACSKVEPFFFSAHFLFLIFKICLERERNINLLFNLFTQSLFDSCISSGIEPTTLVYRDDALTNWATTQGSAHFLSNFVKQY